MVGLEGIEPPTHGLGGLCQLLKDTQIIEFLKLCAMQYWRETAEKNSRKNSLTAGIHYNKYNDCDCGKVLKPFGSFLGKHKFRFVNSKCV